MDLDHSKLSILTQRKPRFSPSPTPPSTPTPSSKPSSNRLPRAIPRKASRIVNVESLELYKPQLIGGQKNWKWQRTSTVDKNIIPYPPGYVEGSSNIDCSDFYHPVLCNPLYPLSCTNCTQSLQWVCYHLTEDLVVDGLDVVIPKNTRDDEGYCLPASFLRVEANPYTTTTVLAFTGKQWEFRYICKYPSIYTQLSTASPCDIYDSTLCKGFSIVAAPGVTVDPQWSPGFDPWYQGVCSIENHPHYVASPSSNLGPGVRLRLMREAIPDFNRPAVTIRHAFISTSESITELTLAGYSSRAITRLRLMPGIWVPRPCRIDPLTGEVVSGAWDGYYGGCVCGLSYQLVGTTITEGGAPLSSIATKVDANSSPDHINACTSWKLPRSVSGNEEHFLMFAMYLESNRYFDCYILVKQGYNFTAFKTPYHISSDVMGWLERLKRFGTSFKIYREYLHMASFPGIWNWYSTSVAEPYYVTPGDRGYEMNTEDCTSQVARWAGSSEKVKKYNGGYASVTCYHDIKNGDVKRSILLLNPSAAKYGYNNFHLFRISTSSGEALDYARSFERPTSKFLKVPF